MRGVQSSAAASTRRALRTHPAPRPRRFRRGCRPAARARTRCRPRCSCSGSRACRSDTSLLVGRLVLPGQLARKRGDDADRRLVSGRDTMPSARATMNHFRCMESPSGRALVCSVVTPILASDSRGSVGPRSARWLLIPPAKDRACHALAHTPSPASAWRGVARSGGARTADRPRHRLAGSSAPCSASGAAARTRRARAIARFEAAYARTVGNGDCPIRAVGVAGRARVPPPRACRSASSPTRRALFTVRLLDRPAARPSLLPSSSPATIFSGWPKKPAADMLARLHAAMASRRRQTLMLGDPANDAAAALAPPAARCWCVPYGYNGGPAGRGSLGCVTASPPTSPNGGRARARRRLTVRSGRAARS